jgi:hypothetical protein
MAERNKKALETKKSKRKSRLSESEIMTILILFHQSHYQNFKQFYLCYVVNILSKEFPKRVSYNRFIELERSVLIPLYVYLETRKISSKGIAFLILLPRCEFVIIREFLDIKPFQVMLKGENHQWIGIMVLNYI